MSWSKTLRGWAYGEEASEAPRAVTGDMARLVALLRQHGRQFEAHGHEAPNENAERGLLDLAAEQRTLVDHLTAELGRRGIAVPEDAVAPAAPSGNSHWARLVQDLEVLQAARARLLEITSLLDEGETDLAKALDGALRTIESHLARLRGLIARADPQALN